MATVFQVQLVPGATMTAADAVYYTAPPLTTTKIGRAVFTNTDTVAHSITANIVPSGGTSVAANTLISARTISPGESYVSPELAGQVIPAGSMLRGLAATAVVLTVSGLTYQQ